MNYPLLFINNTLSNAYVYQSWENLASQVLALEQESYLPYIKKVIKKILQTTNPSHSSLEAILFLLPNISYTILLSGYFCNLKTNQLQSKKELYYTNFILNVTLLMSNTLNEQLSFISLDSFSQGGLGFYFLCPSYIWLRKQIHLYC